MGNVSTCVQELEEGGNGIVDKLGDFDETYTRQVDTNAGIPPYRGEDGRLRKCSEVE
jgi:hypothetical protein